VGYCFTLAQVRHAALVVFPVDCDGDEHVYRIHPINVQLVMDPVKIPPRVVTKYHFQQLGPGSTQFRVGPRV
jgi:hypothetical protein